MFLGDVTRAALADTFAAYNEAAKHLRALVGDVSTSAIRRRAAGPSGGVSPLPRYDGACAGWVPRVTVSVIGLEPRRTVIFTT